jgi:hypothetical protein
MVGLRTRVLGLVIGMLMLSCAGLTPPRRERGRATIGNANAVLHATRSNDEHTEPAERNPRHRVRRNNELLLFLPLSLEVIQTVTSQLDGFVTLQSAGSQTRTTDKATPGFCRLLAARNTTARQLLVRLTPGLATPERKESWRTRRLTNRTSDSLVLHRCDG